MGLKTKNAKETIFKPNFGLPHIICGPFLEKNSHCVCRPLQCLFFFFWKIKYEYKKTLCHVGHSYDQTCSLWSWLSYLITDHRCDQSLDWWAMWIFFSLLWQEKATFSISVALFFAYIFFCRNGGRLGINIYFISSYSLLHKFQNLIIWN